MNKKLSWLTTATLFGFLCIFSGLFGACASDSDSEPKRGECEYPTTQPQSAPCCESRGVDACGAGLTCAALDGRKQATCYEEHSRKTGQGCTADIQCLSNACSDDGKCHPGPGDSCTKGETCGDADEGVEYVCGVVWPGEHNCCTCSSGTHAFDCYSGC